MIEYPKIQSIYRRDRRGRFLRGEHSLPEVEYLAGLEWLWTEKVDGTNIRIGLNDGTYWIGGRTDRAQIPSRLLDGIAALGLQDSMRALTDTNGDGQTVH